MALDLIFLKLRLKPSIFTYYKTPLAIKTMNIIKTI